MRSILLFGLALLTFACAAAGGDPTGRSPGQNTQAGVDLGIPFEIDFEREEETKALVQPKWAFVGIYLPREHFSVENLRRIFRYYSKKYPNTEFSLKIEVYLDRKLRELWAKRKSDPKNIPGEGSYYGLPESL
jgi:hypothetical protein